jgi:hypothetical protein
LWFYPTIGAAITAGKPWLSSRRERIEPALSGRSRRDHSGRVICRRPGTQERLRDGYPPDGDSDLADCSQDFHNGDAT